MEKNKDPVSEDLLVILKGSDEAAVRQLFTESPEEAQLILDRKKGAKFQGVVAKFQQQLSELLAIVESSETHFVRCIKPNQAKSPRMWEDEMVSKQLRCSGIMEAVRVIAAGYPDRIPHSEILGRFAALISPDERPSAEKEGEKAAAAKTLQLLQLDSREFGEFKKAGSRPIRWRARAFACRLIQVRIAQNADMQFREIPKCF